MLRCIIRTLDRVHERLGRLLAWLEACEADLGAVHDLAALQVCAGCGAPGSMFCASCIDAEDRGRVQPR